jgi:hypothetical protein
MNKPLVSIIIPVYNGEKYLADAIESALNQDYDNIEIVVVNDGSTDRTEEIALTFGEKIVYFAQENKGQSVALNNGIDAMKGVYFSWLSHDDTYSPTKISTSIEAIQKFNSRRCFVYSDFRIVDSLAKVIGQVRYEAMAPECFVYNYLTKKGINGCTVLVEKEIIDTFGRFNPTRPQTADVELFLRFALELIPIHIPEMLVDMRSHSEQSTKRNHKRHVQESNEFGEMALDMVSREVLIRSALCCGEKMPYMSLAILWSRNARYKAAKKALELARISEISKSRKSILRVYCAALYIYKIIRRAVADRINQ